MRDQRGQTGAELVGLLLLVALIIAGLVASGAAASIGSHTSTIVCRIAGGDCSAAPPPSAAPGGGVQGPPLTAQDLPVLPWPGTSVAVTCTFAPGGKTCSAPEGSGVGVQAEGRVTVDRGQTTLDDQGCPHQQLSITTTLELQARGAAEGSTASGSLNAHLGHASKYQVTVAPDRADALADGDGAPPNPVDPRTLGAGESVQLSEEYYAGIGAEGQYRAIQARFGYDEGHRVSSAAQRISPTTVRVLAGDADFVRQTLALGLGDDDFGIALGGSEELADGKLEAIDIDVSTPEGWAAYQDFVATGKPPASGTAGTTDPTTSQTLDYSDKTKAEVRLGKVTLGGTLGSSEGHVKLTEHADGSVDVLRTARYNDVGLAIAETKDADDNVTGEPRYSLLLHGVDGSFVDGLQQLDGSSGEVPDGNLRLDLSAGDLETLQHLAREQLADQVELNGDGRPTAEQIGEALADGDGIVEWDDWQADFGAPYTELAGARTPEAMLIALYRMRPDASSVAAELQTLLLDAGVELPGEIVTPDCG